MEKQDQTSSEVEIPDHQALANTIGQGKDSQPTKKKVVAFKARVFKLLKIYCQKSPSIDPLISAINEETLIKDTQRINQLVLSILAKQNLLDQQAMTLLKAYKSLLFYKTQSKQTQQKAANVFTRLLKKTIHNGGDQLVAEMVENFYTKRNCKINGNFFQFLTRKVPATKQVILKKCDELAGKNMRPAQKKQISKMRKKLGRKQKVVQVKEQEVDE